MKNSLAALAAVLLCLPSSALEPSSAMSALRSSAGGFSPASVPGLGAGGPIAAPAGAAGGGVDLSGQFPTASRDQGNVGACHAFASVGLLEAAYFRKYGEHAVFSDADLFLRNTVLNGNIYSGSLFEPGYAWTGRPELKEGGSPSTLLAIGDMEFAIKNGVATTPQYSAFVERYRQFREAEQRTLADIERQRKRDPRYVRLLYNPRTHWAQMQRSPLNQRILQNYLMGNDGTLDAQREEVKRKLAGFTVAKSLYVTLPSSFSRPEKECRRDGAGRTAAVLSELAAGRPVGLSYFTDGNWGSHVLLITGYQAGDGGDIVFKTRNSWGANGNFDMRPSDMCKVHGIFSVRER
ncbi:MAG: hypothetical protein HYV15_07285 [Elusimicrobia bacterium]|nr:hypothetical protein [Elusimicrobiota bacterium]